MEKALKALANHFAEHGSATVQVNFYLEQAVLYMQCSKATADYFTAEAVEYRGFTLEYGPVYSADGSTAVWLFTHHGTGKIVPLLMSQVYATIRRRLPQMLTDGQLLYKDNRAEDHNTVDLYVELLAQAGYKG